MSMVKESGVCDCDCHDGGSIHCVPCCEPCEFCGKNIERGYMRSHLAKCKTLRPEPKPFPARISDRGRKPGAVVTYDPIAKTVTGDRARIDPKMVDKIRQSLQVILTESDNLRKRISQLRVGDDEDVRESAAAIQTGVQRIEAMISGKPVRSAPTKHWLIISAYGGEAVGCCNDQADVLAEEPDSTFEEVNPKKCPVCKEMGR